MEEELVAAGDRLSGADGWTDMQPDPGIQGPVPGIPSPRPGLRVRPDVPVDHVAVVPASDRQ